MSFPIIRAHVDGQGALLDADAPLLHLQRRAGGDIGAPFAMPQLAQLVSRVLGEKRSVMHAVLIGDEERVIHGWAAISPQGDGADVIIRNWEFAVPSVRRTNQRRLHPPTAMGWNWETDAQLRLLSLHVGPSAPPAPEDWSRRLLTQLVSVKRSEKEAAPIWQALRQQIGFADQLVTVDCGGGSHHELVLAGQPIFDATGSFCGFRGSAEPAPTMDIGQCPYFRAPDGDVRGLQFNQRVDDALRIPINRIIATAQAITKEVEGPVRADYARYAGDIAQAGQHLRGLVDDLVDVQNIEMPDFTVARDVLDLADLARSAAGLLVMKAEEKDIRIHVPDANDTLLVTGEHRRVLQILINLLTNAVRYSPAGTQIFVSVENGLMDAQVTVEDQGVGLSAEQQKLIFEKFERLGRRDGGGSGLGLYIARKLARAMDGELRVTSEVGVGSRFTLSLPTHFKA